MFIAHPHPESEQAIYILPTEHSIGNDPLNKLALANFFFGRIFNNNNYTRQEIFLFFLRSVIAVIWISYSLNFP